MMENMHQHGSWCVLWTQNQQPPNVIEFFKEDDHAVFLRSFQEDGQAVVFYSPTKKADMLPAQFSPPQTMVLVIGLVTAIHGAERKIFKTFQIPYLDGFPVIWVKTVQPRRPSGCVSSSTLQGRLSDYCLSLSLSPV